MTLKVRGEGEYFIKRDKTRTPRQARSQRSPWELSVLMIVKHLHNNNNNSNNNNNNNNNNYNNNEVLQFNDDDDINNNN